MWKCQQEVREEESNGIKEGWEHKDGTEMVQGGNKARTNNENSKGTREEERSENMEIERMQEEKQ